MTLHNSCPLCDLSLSTHDATVCAEVQADNARDAAQCDELYMASLDASDARMHRERPGADDADRCPRDMRGRLIRTDDDT